MFYRQSYFYCSVSQTLHADVTKMKQLVEIVSDGKGRPKIQFYNMDIIFATINIYSNDLE